MYQCTLHRHGDNTILVADKWKNLRKLILKKAKPDSLWGMLYKNDRLVEWKFRPVCCLPDKKPKPPRPSNALGLAEQVAPK